MSKKSGKKMKWVIPFAVLSITCAAAGVMAGCNDENNDEGKEHVHAYEWKYDSDGTEHWKECPEDGTVEEGSRGEHVFVAGECECGAVESTAEKKYGTVSGTVKLHKLGGYETDYTGVTIDMGDDVEPVLNKDTGEFTVENVEVGKNYTLKVSKPGYQSYTVSVQSEENKNVTIGGQRGIVLEYEVFGLMAGWDGEYHDFSHVNEEEPYLKFNENDGNKTLNVMSNDSYNEVAATLRIEYNNSLNGMHTQGIVLRFEDGKHLIVRYHNGDQTNGNIQYVREAWAPDTAANTLFGEDAKLNQWGEAPVHTLTSAETAAIKAENGGLELTLVVKGGKMTVLFDGKFVSEYELPDGYENKKVKVGYFAWNTASNAVISYGISEELPTMQTQFDINVEQPEGGNCAVTVSPEKEEYAFGEEVELIFTAPDGYLLDSLTINGEDKFTALSNGKLTLIADSENIVVNAAFVEKEDVALDLTVKGNKLGETVTFAQGTQVTLSGITDKFTVNADGKITADSITKGRYTVSADGYISKEINITSELTEVVLEYDSVKNLLPWGSFDFSNQNAETPEFGITNDCAVILTNDVYDSAMASIYLKGSKMNSGNGGLVFRFVGEGLDEKGEAVTVVMQNTRKVQFAQDNLWGYSTIAAGCVWNNLYYFENCYDDDADRTAGEYAEKYLQEYAEGTLKLSVLRQGEKFIVLLDDTVIGQMSVNEKYANAKCEVGFIVSNLNDTSEWKSWKFEITDDSTKFPGLGVTVTDGTAEDANGSIAISPESVAIGDTVTITVTPDENYMLEELNVSGGVTLIKVDEYTYTFKALSKEHTVTATFIEKGSIDSVMFTVSDGWDADGLQVTLSREGSADITGTITDGKFVAENVDKGEWTLKTEIFGAPVSLVVEVLNGELKLDFSSLFANASQAKTNVSLGNGNITYHGNVKEDIAVKTNITGSAWIAGKISMTEDDFQKLMNGNQVSLGMYITFSDGTYKYTGWNLANKTGDMHLCLTGSDGWESGHTWGEGCSSGLGVINADNTYTLNKYGQALFGGDGLYYILNYDEDTGDLSVYYATSAQDVVLAGVVARYTGKGAIEKFGVNSGINWGETDVTFNVSDFAYNATLGGYFGITEQAITVTGGGQLEHGKVEVSNAYVGRDIVIKVTPEDGYKLTSLKVNDAVVNVGSMPLGASYKVNGYLNSELKIETEFEELVYGSLNAEIYGKKFGVEANALTDGTVVTLSRTGYESIQITLEDGNLTLTESKIVAGDWTVRISGYKSANITVAPETAYSEKIVLEYNTFSQRHDWGSLISSEQNDGVIGATNECQVITTNDTYSEVAFSVMLGGENAKSNNTNQGIAFYFGDGTCALIRMTGTSKIEFDNDGGQNWFTGDKAEGSGWQDLIVFEGDNAQYIDKYNAGTLELTGVRKGSTIYVFLDGEYIGQRTFNEKYSESKVKVGVYYMNTDNNVDHKWNFGIETDITDYLSKIV